MKKIRRICLSDKQVMKKEEMGHVVAGSPNDAPFLGNGEGSFGVCYCLVVGNHHFEWSLSAPNTNVGGAVVSTVQLLLGISQAFNPEFWAEAVENLIMGGSGLIENVNGPFVLYTYYCELISTLPMLHSHELYSTTTLFDTQPL